jgi:hypothetical protein
MVGTTTGGTVRKKRTVIELHDDFDASPDATTVQFAFEGVSYEIELSEKHLEEMRAHLAPYIEHGRRTGGRRKNAGRPQVAESKPDSAAIRAWAEQQGIELASRGKIPKAVVEQYDYIEGH